MRPQAERFGRFNELQKKLGVELRAINQAISETESELSDLERLIVPSSGRALVEDASVVFFGSVARGETTSKSDADWILLVDGQVDEEHFRTFQSVRRLLREGGKISPGNTGTFGGLVFSHDIVHRIGGQDDLNQNLTLRMLLLLESVSIGDDAARQRVVRAILERYLADDVGWKRDVDGKIPRFLLNDFVRFWRTMAVDFADKFHDQVGEKWALRNAKLRFSRKLIFLISLLVCFSWHLRRSSEDTTSTHSTIAYFERYLSRPPLEIVADEMLHQNISEAIAENFFGSYNEFLQILNDKEKREALTQLSKDLSRNDQLFLHVRAISHKFQAAITSWLFASDSQICKLVITYGVF
jgi:predicted nucleotidyltransferase